MSSIYKVQLSKLGGEKTTKELLNEEGTIMCALFLIFGFFIWLLFFFFVTASHPFSSVFTGTLYVGRVALKPTDMQLLL